MHRQIRLCSCGLLSQAEHGVDSQAMLITTSEKLQTEVMAEVERQLAELPRREIASRSLENSKLILVRNIDEALELTNAYAPEHLIVETENYMEVAERVTNAGSVFLGALTPESAGDYVPAPIIPCRLMDTRKHIAV